MTANTNNSETVSTAPDDLIPESQKGYQWHLDKHNNILRRYDANEKERVKDAQNMAIVKGVLNPKEYEYVTNQYNISAPARMVNYPLIAPKLDLLAGEFVSQPLQFSSIVINKDAVVSKLDEQRAIVADSLLKPLRKQFEEITGVEFSEEDQGMEIPEDIESFLNTPYRTSIEDQIDIGLKFLIEKHDLKQTFKKVLYNFFVTGKAFFHVRRDGIDPVPFGIDPRDMIYPQQGYRDDLKKSSYLGYDVMMTINEISELFLDQDLSKEDWQYIESMRGQTVDYFRENNFGGRYYDYNGGDLKVRVSFVQYKTLKAMKYKVSENKYDPEHPFYKMVKDDYKPKKNERVVTKYIQYLHESYKVGHEKIFAWGPVKDQIRYEDNYANCSFDIVGCIKDQFDGNTLSVVDTTKNIQALYNIVMYHIAVTLQRAGGKAMVYDTSQIPKDMKMSHVMHYAKNHGIIPINSQQDGGQGRSFNQFQSIDFTLGNSFIQLVNLKQVLEETMSTLTGISAARAGVNKASDLVGVNERNVMQSSLMTAPYFDAFYSLIGDVLQLCSNKMKEYWAGQEVMVNTFGDLQHQIMKFDKSISSAEYGIFIQNSGYDKQKKDQFMMLMERFSQTGQVDPLTAVKAVNADNSNDIEKILTQALEGVQAAQVQMQQQQQQIDQQKTQNDQQKMQIDLQKTQMTNEKDLEVAKMNNRTKMLIKDKEGDIEAEKFDAESAFGEEKSVAEHEQRMAEYAMQNSINQTQREVERENSGQESSENQNN